MVKYSKFRNAETEAKINEMGYVSMPSFFSTDEMNALKTLYKKYYSEPDSKHGHWFSVQHLDKKLGMEFSLLATEIIKPKIEEHFEDAYIPFVNFLVKHPNDSSQMDAHRDNSVFDETKFGYRNLWIPLIDTDQNNGTLFVLPKSHKYLNEIFPMGDKWPYSKFSNIITKYVNTLYLKRGDLLVYDQSMVHGSWQNKSDTPRPVVMLGIMNKEYELVYYKVESTTPEMTVTAYKVKPDFYLDTNNFTGIKEEDILFKTKINYKPYSPEEFETLLEKMSKD